MESCVIHHVDFHVSCNFDPVNAFHSSHIRTWGKAIQNINKPQQEDEGGNKLKVKGVTSSIVRTRGLLKLERERDEQKQEDRDHVTISSSIVPLLNSYTEELSPEHRLIPKSLKSQQGMYRLWSTASSRKTCTSFSPSVKLQIDRMFAKRT